MEASSIGLYPDCHFRCPPKLLEYEYCPGSIRQVYSILILTKYRTTSLTTYFLTLHINVIFLLPSHSSKHIFLRNFSTKILHT